MENHIFAFSINSLKTNRPKQSFLKATDLHYPLLDATYTASSATSTNNTLLLSFSAPAIKENHFQTGRIWCQQEYDQ